MKKIISLIFFTILILMGTGCTTVPPETPPINSDYGSGTYEEYNFELNENIDSSTFSSEEELTEFLKKTSGNSYFGATFGLSRNTVMVEAGVDSINMDVAVSAPKASGGDESFDYSETNVQVQGIDEADIIKTDGEYIYTVSGNVLFIVRAYPGEDAEIVSKTKLESRPESIFINENSIAVFGNFNNQDYFSKVNFQPRYGMTYLNIYDISEKDSPKLEKEYKFEGNYFNGRMKEGYMYLLTSAYPNYQIDPIMPVMFEGNVRSIMPTTDIYYYNIPYDNPMFVNIHAVNLNDIKEEISSKAIAVESSQNVYMSHENIYITYTEYVNEYEIEQEVMMEILEPSLTDENIELIEKIKATDNDVLSRREKQSKIYTVYMTVASSMSREEQDDLGDDVEAILKEKLEEYEHFEYTIINKIEVDKMEIDPSASGKVPGRTINQFSMDENNDVFRIATTISPRWSRFDKDRSTSTNNVYTLDQNLNILGELEGLAEDESIYSTRFMGNRLYMVTFKQVDPFFVIDLSDPENPKSLGELKIPGFSRYLHPYDEDTIIGIGQDATETGRTKGLKISLFDVSDVENPKEVSKYVSESRYASSTALYEHKAFLFSKEKNLLVIPAYNYNYEDSTENYNGAFVFDISKEDIELRGLIDHSSSAENRWNAAVERSLYIEELLYTKSPNLLRINELDSLEKVKNIDLEYTDNDIPIY